MTGYRLADSPLFYVEPELVVLRRHFSLGHPAPWMLDQAVQLAEKTEREIRDRKSKQLPAAFELYRFRLNVDRLIIDVVEGLDRAGMLPRED